MRIRKLVGAFMLFVLLLPSVAGAVDPSSFGFSKAEINQMKRLGANPAKVRALLAGMESYIVQLARRRNVPAPALRGSLTQKIIRGPAVDQTLERAVAQVEATAEQLVALNAENKALREQISQISDAKLRNPALAALAEAQKAIDEGRLEDAERVLATQEPLRMSEAAGAIDAWSAVVELRANIAILQGDYDGAVMIANDADKKVQFQLQQMIAQRWKYKMIKAVALYRKGNERGDNATLEDAIRIYRDEALPLAPRTERPDDWANTYHELGNALATIGERENGTARLEEAELAIQEALKHYSLALTPHEWATTKNDLGNVLEAIGSRRESPTLYEAAVTAYKDALKVRTRRSFPLDWAATKHNLCNLYERQGKMEESASILESAVSACNEALEERTKYSAPIDWADSNHSLGVVLSDLGLLEKRMQRFVSAREAYNAALSVYDRDRMPLKWAMATSGLAFTETLFARVDGNQAQLDRAELLVNDARRVVAGKHTDAVMFCDYVLQLVQQTRTSWQNEAKK